MTLEKIEELYKNKEIDQVQYLSMKSRLKVEKSELKHASNHGESVEYWYQHVKHAMLGDEKRDDDNSNAEWTRGGINKLYEGIMPFGFSGTNGTIAIIKFTKEYHPDKLKIAIQTLIKGVTNATQLEYLKSEAIKLGI